MKRTNQRAFGGGCYVAALTDAENVWLSDLLSQDPLWECLAIIRYRSPRKPAELLLESRSDPDWPEPAEAIPAFAEALRQFLAAWRPLQRLVLSWAIWPVGAYTPRSPLAFEGGEAVIDAHGVHWRPFAAGQPQFPPEAPDERAS